MEVDMKGMKKKGKVWQMVVWMNLFPTVKGVDLYEMESQKEWKSFYLTMMEVWISVQKQRGACCDAMNSPLNHSFISVNHYNVIRQTKEILKIILLKLNYQFMI